MAFVSRGEFMALVQRIGQKFGTLDEQLEICSQSLGNLRGDQSVGLQRIAEASQKLQDDTEKSLA